MIGEVDDAAHIGTAESVDGLVGITHDDEVAAVAGQGLQELDLERVGVLVLVDDDEAQAAPPTVADLRDP